MALSQAFTVASWIEFGFGIFGMIAIGILYFTIAKFSYREIRKNYTKRSEVVVQVLLDTSFWIFAFFTTIIVASLALALVVPTNGENTFVLRTTLSPLLFSGCTQALADDGICALWSRWIMYIPLLAIFAGATAIFTEISMIPALVYMIFAIIESAGLAIASILGDQMPRIAAYIFSGIAFLGITAILGTRILNYFGVDFYKIHTPNPPSHNTRSYRVVSGIMLLLVWISYAWLYINFLISPTETGVINTEEQAISFVVTDVVFYVLIPITMAIMWSYRSLKSRSSTKSKRSEDRY